MLRDTALLLQLYWRVDRRENSALPRSARIFSAILGIIFGVFAAFMGFAAGRFVTDPGAPLDIAPGLIPGALLTILLFAVVVVGLNQALTALFLSGDTERLLAAPVDTRAVMTAKLLSRLPLTFLVLLLIVVPAFITYGIGAGLGFGYYIVGALLVLVAPLFGLSIGALASLVLVRLIPPRRLSEYVGAISIIFSTLLVLIFQLPALMGGRFSDSVGQTTLEGFEETLANVQAFPLPSLWAGRGVVELGQGRASVVGLGGIAAFLVLTLGLFALTTLVADRLYLSGLLRIHGATGSRRSLAEDKAGVFGGRSLDAALAVKDWLLRLREPRQLARALTSVVGVAIFLFFLLRPNDEAGLSSVLTGEQVQRPGLPGMLLTPGVVASGSVLMACWLFFQQFALTSLSLEQRAFYVLKAAPISPRQVFRSKVLSVAVPYALVGTILYIATWYVFRFSLAWLPYGWVCLLLIGVGLIAFTTATGFRFANLEWDDPRRMNPRGAGLYSTVGTFAYGILAALIALGGFLAAQLLDSMVLVPLLGLGLLGALTWLYVWYAGRRAAQAWPKLGTT